MEQHQRVPDGRGHRSLVSEKDLEWITNIPGELIPLINPLLEEADEFADYRFGNYCRRFLRLRTSIGGKRADLMADVAKHDEALQDLRPEAVVHRPRA